MKVDITLTVGGTDVSIDMNEARKLYLDLASILDTSYYNSMMTRINDAQSKCDSSTPSLEELHKKANEEQVKSHRTEEDVLQVFKDAEDALNIKTQE